MISSSKQMGVECYKLLYEAQNSLGRAQSLSSIA